MATSLPLFDESTLPSRASFSPTPPVKKPATAVSNDYITELLVSRYCPNYLQLLLPMLSHQSRITDSRWITWIATSKLEKDLLASFGVDTSKVRFVYASSSHVIFDLVIEALKAGNSHCVVAINENFLPEQMHLLSSAAQIGDTVGILVSCRD